MYLIRTVDSGVLGDGVNDYVLDVSGYMLGLITCHFAPLTFFRTGITRLSVGLEFVEVIYTKTGRGVSGFSCESERLGLLRLRMLYLGTLTRNENRGN